MSPHHPLNPHVTPPPPEPTQPPPPPPPVQLPQVPLGVKVPGGCNCRRKADCPIPGMCQTSSVVHQCVIEEVISKKTEKYIGLTGGQFKTRFNQHKCDFRNIRKRGTTTLSEHVWKLREQGIEYTATWKLIKQLNTYNPTRRQCPLCLEEKFIILFNPEKATLNQRSELSTACRHKAAFLLSNS